MRWQKHLACAAMPCKHASYKAVVASQHVWLQVSPASPIHGPNQWPTQRPTFDTALREYIDSMLHLGQHLMRGKAQDQTLPVLQADSQLVSQVHRFWHVNKKLMSHDVTASQSQPVDEPSPQAMTGTL